MALNKSYWVNNVEGGNKFGQPDFLLFNKKKNRYVAGFRVKETHFNRLCRKLSEEAENVINRNITAAGIWESGANSSPGY